MATTHFKDCSTKKNDTKEVLKVLVTLIGDKVAVAKKAVHLRDDHEKKKADAAMMKVDAINTIDDAAKMKVELKLRKQDIRIA